MIHKYNTYVATSKQPVGEDLRAILSRRLAASKGSGALGGMSGFG